MPLGRHCWCRLVILREGYCKCRNTHPGSKLDYAAEPTRKYLMYHHRQTIYMYVSASHLLIVGNVRSGRDQCCAPAFSSSTFDICCPRAELDLPQAVSAIMLKGYIPVDKGGCSLLVSSHLQQPSC